MSKLHGFPKSQIRNNRDSNGDSVHTAVKNEVYRLRPLKKYIQLKFWRKLISQFGLNGTVADDLPKPTAAEPVSRDLEAALKVAHHQNPAEKNRRCSTCSQVVAELQ